MLTYDEDLNCVVSADQSFDKDDAAREDVESLKEESPSQSQRKTVKFKDEEEKLFEVVKDTPKTPPVEKKKIMPASELFPPINSREKRKKRKEKVS